MTCPHIEAVSTYQIYWYAEGKGAGFILYLHLNSPVIDNSCAPDLLRSTEGPPVDTDSCSLIHSRVSIAQIPWPGGSSVYVTVLEPEAEIILAIRQPVSSEHSIEVTEL